MTSNRSKFRNQFQPLAVSVSFWWLLVWESLQALKVDEEQAKWLTSTLLPVVYWHYKMQQTKNPKANLPKSMGKRFGYY